MRHFVANFGMFPGSAHVSKHPPARPVQRVAVRRYRRRVAPGARPGSRASRRGRASALHLDRPERCQHHQQRHRLHDAVDERHPGRGTRKRAAELHPRPAADIKDNPTLELWMHNEFDQKDAEAGNFSAADWTASYEANKRLVEDAWGHGVTTEFVPIRYNWGNIGPILDGMRAAVANGTAAGIDMSAYDLARMDWGGGPPNTEHMSGSDAAIIADALAKNLAPTVQALAASDTSSSTRPHRAAACAGQPGHALGRHRFRHAGPEDQPGRLPGLCGVHGQRRRRADRRHLHRFRFPRRRTIRHPHPQGRLGRRQPHRPGQLPQRRLGRHRGHRPQPLPRRRHLQRRQPRPARPGR